MEKINNTILRHLSGIGNPNRPLGSFLLIGPTGVGKTMTAKLLAKAISLGRKNSLIHINMSEFMQHHNVSRLLGAPAGYVGYEESGELTEKIRRNPYSVVLFDEIEKADPGVLNILLQILEEGAIVDAKGRLVNFKNTIIILTSNIGTAELDNIAKLGFEYASKEISNKEKLEKRKRETEKIILKEIEEVLSPELVGRLDEVVVFSPLDEKSIGKIVKIELEKIGSRLKEKSIILTVSKAAIKYISQQTISPKQGARFVRKYIQQEIEPLIAEKIMSGKNLKKIAIGVNKGEINVK